MDSISCAEPVNPRGKRSRPVSVALGGGGALGIAFHLGVVRGLEAEGVVLKTNPMIGVSAGTWAAASLALDTPIEALAEVYPKMRETPHAPIEEVAREVFGDAHDHRVTGAAITLPSRRRALLNGADLTLAEVIAASSSPPWLAAPMRIGGQRYYDPGILHNSCADLAAPGDAMIVLAPLGFGTLKSQGIIWERRLRRETWLWRRNNSGTVTTIRPSHEVLAWAGQTWSAVLDGRRMMRTYDMAFDHGRSRARSIRAGMPSVTEN